MTDTYNSGFYQTDVRQQKAEGFVGALAKEDSRKFERSYVNRDPQAKQVDTLTIASGATAVFTYNGIQYTVTTNSGTAAGDAALVEAAILAEGAIYGGVDVELASNVLTLTAKNPGFSFTLASGTNATAASVTAADEADPIAFGRAVVRRGYPASGADASQETARLADSNAFTAQLSRWDFDTLAASDEPAVSLKVLGADAPSIEVFAEWDTDEDTTLDNLATAINAKLVDAGLDSYVTAAGPSGAPGAGQLEIVAAIAGVEFWAVASCDRAAVVITEDPATVPASPSTSLMRAMAGMAKRQALSNEAVSTDPSGSEYPANSQILVVEEGEVWVENSETLTYASKVYVELTAGSDAGKFYAAPGAGRVPLPFDKAEWLRRSVTSADSLGLLRLK